MGDFYLGEIRLFPYNNIIDGWKQCDGQLLEITRYQALYSLLGTQFGGDGKKNFALPDLRGRTVMGLHSSDPFHRFNQIGLRNGTETVALSTSEMPKHTHQLYCTKDNATSPGPVAGSFASPTPPATLPNPPASPPVYKIPKLPSELTPLNHAAITTTGAGAPHENRQPFLALVYAMAITGLYPTPN